MHDKLGGLRVGLLAFCLSAVSAVPASAGDVTIAVVGPLTGSLGPEGQRLVDGVSLAIDAINATGGLLGQKLTSVDFDDSCDTDQAAAAAASAIAAGPSLIVGHFCSAASIRAAPLYAKAGILHMSPISVSPKLTELGIPTLFRISGRTDREAIVIAQAITVRWPTRRIAVLDDGSVFGKGLADAVRQGLAERHIPVQMSSGYRPEAGTYVDIVAPLKDQKIDLLFLGGYSADIGLLVRQIGEAGLSIQSLTDPAAADVAFSQIAGKAAEGVMFTASPDPTASSAVAPLIAAARARQIDMSPRIANAYAAVEVWAAAVRRAQSFDTAKVGATLHATSFDTVLGPVSFDAKGDNVGPAGEWVWYRWHGGKVERAEP